MSGIKIAPGSIVQSVVSGKYYRYDKHIGRGSVDLMQLHDYFHNRIELMKTDLFLARMSNGHFVVADGLKRAVESAKQRRGI